MRLRDRLKEWKFRQHRVRGTGQDWEWLGEAQAHYPEAFEKTVAFIESLEADANKTGIEAGKHFPLPNGGMLWLIAFGICAWTAQHMDDQWLTCRSLHLI